VFLEAFSGAAHGDVLVVDDGGREDEASVGDLVVLEAQAAGVGGVMVWGLHRDTAELTQIALPVFSYGHCPAGPVRLDEQEPSALASARFRACLVTRDDIVFGDDDGVVFVAASQAGEVLAAARQIGGVERDQARKVQAGVRPCASRQPSANTWRGGQPSRPTPSGGTCGGSAVPSRSRQP
jgi:regulator of RNase E activity RraA